VAGTEASDGSTYMQAWAQAPGDDYGQCSSQSFLGFYLYPGDISSATNGYLSVSASIPLNWWYDCMGALRNAWTSGWFGFRIEGFDLSGNWVGTQVDQRISLFNDHCFDSHDDDAQANSGYFINAGLWVDTDHYYNIWVQAYSHAHANGSDWFSSSGAYATVNVSVTNVFWALY
jgi:hypothetical protein